MPVTPGPIVAAATISGSNQAITIPDNSDGTVASVLLSSTANNDTITLDGNDFVHGLPAGSNVNYFITGSGNDSLNVINASISGSGGGDSINGVGIINSITIAGSDADTIHGHDGSIIDNGSGNNLLYALQAGSHTITTGSGNDTITVRDGIHLSANTTTITVNNFISGHDEIALSQSVGEGLFNSTNLASSIASHISGNTFTAGHLTINFVGHTPVAADFILVI